MTDTEKNVELISMYARINAAIDIEKEFDRLFKVLNLLPADDPTMVQRDIINVLITFKETQIFRGVKDGICDKEGEPI